MHWATFEAGGTPSTSSSHGEKVMKREEILQKLASGELTVEAANELLEEAEGRKRGSLYCKVSQKGAISVYGLQRMPVTLYVEQWERLLGFADEIRRFAEQNDAQLSRKGAAREADK
jgi:hypothetical protein